MFSCILCSNKGFGIYKHGIRDAENIDVVKCQECGHVQLYPLYSDEEVKQYYNKDRQMKALIPEVDNKIIERNMVWTEQQVRKSFSFISESPCTLEIGSGYGLFLKRIKDDLGFNIEGIEISEERKDFAQNYTSAELQSINLLTDAIPDNMKNKYSLIVSFHVLEHISKPLLFLQKVSDMLNCGGGVFLRFQIYMMHFKKLVFHITNSSGYKLMCRIFPKTAYIFYSKKLNLLILK